MAVTIPHPAALSRPTATLHPQPPPLSETPDDEGEIETVYTPGGVATATAAAMASSGGAKAPADSSQLRAAAEAMKRDPEMARAQMEMLANMTQEQIDAMLQASGQTLPDGQKLTPGDDRACIRWASAPCWTPGWLDNMPFRCRRVAHGVRWRARGDVAETWRLQSWRGRSRTSSRV